MSQILNTELLDALKKSLPANLSEVLNGELSELERYRKSEPQVKEDRIKLAELKVEKSSWVDLLELREKLEKERNKFEVEKRDFYIKVLNEKYQDTIKLMDSVFRNQRLVHHKTSNDSFPVNQNGYMSTVSGYSTATTEVKED